MVIRSPQLLSFRGVRSTNPESRGSGFASRPGTTPSINRRLADRRAKAGFEKIEITAFISLLDVASEHPAIAALETTRGLLPFGTAFCQFGFAHLQIDPAGRALPPHAAPLPHPHHPP